MTVTCLTLNAFYYSLLEVVAIGLLLIKLSQHYSNIKPYIDDKFSKHYVTLFSSFVLLLGIAHLFGLMMFAVSSVSDRNWLAAAGLREEDWDVKYIYSVYWAITTIVTVGYGDITPKNKYEVLVVILVEIVGTSIFGYMINVIGMSLTEMKRERETLDHELSVVDKISKCFGIKPDLTYQMKNHLTNNQKVDRTFSLQEEANVMQKLNPMLRDDIIRDTNNRILRKSLFFLTNFNWSTQLRLSIKLLKKIVQPTEVLESEDSIFIVDRGELAVQLSRSHRTRVFTKCIRTIRAASGSSDISNNAYGYSSTITGRKIRTKAVGNAFTILFELQRKHLFEVVQSGSLKEYEALCDLRDKFNEYPNLDTVEAPELQDSKKHYQSNKSFLKLWKRSYFQSRRLVIRYSRLLIDKFGLEQKSASEESWTEHSLLNDDNPLDFRGSGKLKTLYTLHETSIDCK